MFWRQVIRYVFCKYFSPVSGLSFYSLNSFFHREKGVLYFSKVQHIHFFLSRIMLWVLYLKNVLRCLAMLLCLLTEVLLSGIF